MTFLPENKQLAMIRVFVYGTLKPGESNYQGYCAQTVVEVKQALAFGQLFSLPLGYPAMTIGNSPVQGFLLSFSNSDILTQLDWLEDYDPRRPLIENEYHRQQIETFDIALQPLGKAWTYLMTPQQVHSHGGVLLQNGYWTGRVSSE